MINSDDKEYLSSKLVNEFNDKDYMKDIIASNPRAVYFLGESIKHDVDLNVLAIVTFFVLGLEDEIRKLMQERPASMRSIDHLLAENLLKGDGLKFLSFFENTNPSLYFKYLHQACLTLDASVQLDWNRMFCYPRSQRSEFIDSLLVNDINCKSINLRFNN